MVKFEDIYQSWLETQEKKEEIIALVEKFFDGFRGLYGIECRRVDNHYYDYSNFGWLYCDERRFGIKDLEWFFYVQGDICFYSKSGCERFTFIPRTIYEWNTCTITSLLCSMCRQVINNPTPEQAKRGICHKHNLLT